MVSGRGVGEFNIGGEVAAHNANARPPPARMQMRDPAKEVSKPSESSAWKIEEKDGKVTTMSEAMVKQCEEN